MCSSLICRIKHSAYTDMCPKKQNFIANDCYPSTQVATPNLRIRFLFHTILTEYFVLHNTERCMAKRPNLIQICAQYV